jgi:RNA polymerase sigma-70 factor (ECF subfamily)
MSANPNSARLADPSSLVTSLRPALVKYFMRKCHHAAESEDMAQEVVLRALKAARWQTEQQARGFIFRIAMNLWHDRNRRLSSHGTVIEWDDDALFAEVEETSPERVLAQEEELETLHAALQSLNERTRDIFVLFRLEQMKQGEIGAVYGISVSAVEKHIAKALSHLMRFVSESRKK